MYRALGNKTIWYIKRVVQYMLLALYKVTFGLYLRIKYKVKLTSSKINIKGPYLLFANHSNNFDGLFLQQFLRQPVYFIVTDAVFKKKMLRSLLSLAGYIPKKKFVSDAKTIRQILKAVKLGGSIGIFPEGARCWDGKSLHISEAAFKLVKLLKIPVVTAKLRGAYFSAPRWADTKRRGRIEVDFKLLIDSNEIPSMSIDDIKEKMTLSLKHNDFDWQQKNMITYRGKALAEGIERLLYLCPHCRSIGTLSSLQDSIRCVSCLAEYRLDEHGFIHSVNGYLPSKKVDILNGWQYEELKRHIETQTSDDSILLADNGAILWAAESDDAPFMELERGSLYLNKKGIMIKSHIFNIEAVHGLSVYFKSGLSFRYRSRDYRVSFDDPRISVYKWCKAMSILKNIPEEVGF